MTLPIEPYRPRRIQPLGVVERAGWTIKVIGITASELPDEAQVKAALEVTERELPRSESPEAHERNTGPAEPHERDFRTSLGSKTANFFVAMWKSSGQGGARRSKSSGRARARRFGSSGRAEAQRFESPGRAEAQRSESPGRAEAQRSESSGSAEAPQRFEPAGRAGAQRIEPPNRTEAHQLSEPPGRAGAQRFEPAGRAGAHQRSELVGRHPRLGFCIVHRGAEALWVLVCWWDLDLMYERLWRADLGSTDLRPVPPDGPTACVWELQAICHERQAWIDHVLTNPAAPDFAGYLAATLTVAGSTS